MGDQWKGLSEQWTPPLYYSFSDYLVAMPFDVVKIADQDYSREAVAYEHLHKMGHTGLFAPKYFDSWTFILSFSHENKIHQRLVRLVLIEYLNNGSIMDLDVRNNPDPNAELDVSYFNRRYRLQILARILHGVSKQHHVGLSWVR